MVKIAVECGKIFFNRLIYDATPSNSGDWEEQWEAAKKSNDGWIQCDGTGEVIEIPNLSALGGHCRHLDSREGDDFDGDADSARLRMTRVPDKEWRVEGDSGGTLEDMTFGRKQFQAEGLGNYTVWLKFVDKEVQADIEVYNVPPEIVSMELVKVNNVAPTFSAGSDVTIDEAGTFTLLLINFYDKGTADTHTATIDWGDILSKDPNNAELGNVDESPFGPPGSTDGANGIIVGSSFDYGDNSIYTVEVCVTDDDGGTGCDDLEVTVNNIDPMPFR